MEALRRLLPLLRDALGQALDSARVHPDFAALALTHVKTVGEFGLAEPSFYPVGLPLAIAEAHLPAPRGLMDVLAGSICYYCGLHAIDDVQDGELEKWPGLAPEAVLNLGVALQFAAVGSYRRAGCSPAFCDAMSCLALEAAAGQALDLESRPERLPALSEDDYRRLNGLKTGSTLELFARAVCDILELPAGTVARYARWARSLGICVQTLGDHLDVRNARSVDLRAGKMSFPIIHFFRTQEPAESEAMLADLAEYDRDPAAAERIRSRLESAGSLAYGESRLQELARQLDSEVGDLVPPANAAALRLLIPTLEEHQGHTGDAPPVEAPAHVAVAASIAQAIAAIDSTPDWSESWDVHRWGFGGHDVLVGDIFPVALIAEALGGCGKDLSPARALLVRRRTEPGWVYFPDMPELPPDCDVLGQILQVFSGSGAAPDPFEEPLRMLLAELGAGGEIPTWLAHDEFPAPEPWPGNRCLAAIANAHTGLLAHDTGRFATQVERGIRFLLDEHAAAGDWHGVWYIQAYSRHVATRLLVNARSRLRLGDADLARISACNEATRQALLAEFERRGTWGGPLATALAISTMCLLGATGSPVGQAASQLLASQRPDGYWDASPLYLTPARGGGMGWYGSKSVTSAFCVRALSQFLAAGPPA